MDYEDRLVAFLDILDFRGMVNSTIDKDGNDVPNEIAALEAAYDTIHRNWDSDPNSSKQVTIFSDSIVISVRADEPSELFWTILEIKHLIMALVGQGILVRGALVRGRLLHNEKRVFGPALVEAYLLESKAALYPRIILDRDLTGVARTARSPHHSKREEKKFVDSLLEQDSDGMMYVDYFSKAAGELDDPQYDFPVYIGRLANIIRKGLQGSTHPSRADVRIKYFWMRERYHRMVEEVQKPLTQKYAEGEEPDELDAVYMGLRKIGRAS
jgi:hypothetical protein